MRDFLIYDLTGDRTSLAVILKQVKKIVQQFQDGKREGSIFSSLSVDSLTSDERAQWRTIRKELERSGLTLAVLDENRELILECLVTTLNLVETADRNTSQVIEGKGKERLVDSGPMPGRVSTSTYTKKCKGMDGREKGLLELPSRESPVFSNIASHPIGARDRIATPVRRDPMRCDDFRCDPIASLSHRA